MVAFGARRLKGRIGVVVTERTDPSGYGATWLQLNRLDGVERVRVSPLSLGGLRNVIVQPPRSHFLPADDRADPRDIRRKPFLCTRAGALDGRQDPSSATELPRSLSDLVRSRLDQLGEDSPDRAVAAACVGTPTVDVLAEASHETIERVVELLEVAESNGIVQIDGNRVRFTHPLLARGVYSVVGPVRRRQMHRTLADIVEQPELRARHLALAASSADPSTLLALDTAADSARARGAPAAAAELLDLAINLGGDKPIRRIRCAEHHFRAGESERADRMLKPTVDEIAPVDPLRASALNLLAAIRINDDGLQRGRSSCSNRALDDAEGDRALMVQSLLLSSFA